MQLALRGRLTAKVGSLVSLVAMNAVSVLWGLLETSFVRSEHIHQFAGQSSS